MKNNLIVVGEPEVIPLIGTRNNALNEILNKYTMYNKSVCYFSSSKVNENYTVDGVSYFGLSVYSKKSRFVFNQRKLIKNYFIDNILNKPNFHLQFRIPSLFSLQIYIILKDILPNDTYSFYMAGDWKESLKFNYPQKYWFLKHLDKLQRYCIKNKKVVFTGHALMNKHQDIVSNGHPFYSTTHSDSDITFSDGKYSKKNICFIGRIELLKNFKFIISLAENQLLNGYIFHFLGDGPKMSELISLVNEKKLDNIKIHGHVKDRIIFDEIVCNCKYFILPSYTEGTSKTLPEMMCRSIVPFAFSGVGGNDEILRDAGVLVDVDDVEGVIENILNLDTDFTAYQNLLTQGHDYAKRNTIENQLNLMFGFLYER